MQARHHLLFHRRKVAGIEIDLILHDAEGVIQFVEVKTCRHEQLVNYRISPTQMKRLHRAKTIFESRFGLPTEIIFAAVYSDHIDTFIIG